MKQIFRPTLAKNFLDNPRITLTNSTILIFQIQYFFTKAIRNKNASAYRIFSIRIFPKVIVQGKAASKLSCLADQ